MKQAHATGQPFRLVLLNARMPDMDSFALTRLLGQDPALESAAMVMLCAPDRKCHDLHGHQCRAAACLVKPIGQPGLRETLLQALDSPRPAKAPAAVPASPAGDSPHPWKPACGKPPTCFRWTFKCLAWADWKPAPGFEKKKQEVAAGFPSSP